jgi:DNA-directed RNA polymerase subunit beta'
MFFTDVQEAHRAYESRTVDLQARIKVRLREYVMENGTLKPRRRLVATTVGRALLSEILPRGLSFDLINQDMTKKVISACINACYRALGLKRP